MLSLLAASSKRSGARGAVRRSSKGGWPVILPKWEDAKTTYDVLYCALFSGRSRSIASLRKLEDSSCEFELRMMGKCCLYAEALLNCEWRIESGQRVLYWQLVSETSRFRTEGLPSLWVVDCRLSRTPRLWHG